MGCLRQHVLLKLPNEENLDCLKAVEIKSPKGTIGGDFSQIISRHYSSFPSYVQGFFFSENPADFPSPIQTENPSAFHNTCNFRCEYCTNRSAWEANSQSPAGEASPPLKNASPTGNHQSEIVINNSGFEIRRPLRNSQRRGDVPFCHWRTPRRFKSKFYLTLVSIHESLDADRGERQGEGRWPKNDVA